MVRAQPGGRWTWGSVFSFSLFSYPPLFLSDSVSSVPRPLRLSQIHHGSVSDHIPFWRTSSYQPLQSQWLDSRDNPIPNAVRNPRVPYTILFKPKDTILPTTPPNTLPSHNAPEAANVTQLKLLDRSDLEEFDLSDGIDNFKSILLEYGRTIIRSARGQDQDPDAQSPQTEIFNAKECVVAYYVSTAQSLLEDLKITKEVLFDQRGRIGELEEIAALEEEKSSRIQDLELEVELLKADKKEGEGHLAEKERFRKFWEEEKEEKSRLEAELAGIKEGHKRKREIMDEVWRKMERAVEQ